MISLISDNKLLEELKFSDIYEGKIKVLYQAYGSDYDFCSFYKQDNSLIMSKLDRDFVIKSYTEDYDAGELAAYLKANRATSVFLSESVLRQLEPCITGEYLYNNLMEYIGEYEEHELDEKPKLDEVYSILKHGFNINYENWITDVSHRIRHGISKTVLYKNASTVTVLYDRDDIVFLTQVATLPECRGKGLATEMLREVSGRYSKMGKRVLLVCRDKMQSFYENVGYKRIDSAAQIYRLDV